MREIEFRAVAKNKKRWVYGDLIHDGTGYSIIEHSGGCIKVKPETAGQYTGLKDKNGKKIFEGDIVRYIDNDLIEYVEFIDGVFFAGSEELKYAYCEVIGNIYDNKEMLDAQK